MISALVGAGVGILAGGPLLVVARRWERGDGERTTVPGTVGTVAVLVIAVAGGAAAGVLTQPWLIVAFAVFGVLAVIAVAVDLAEFRLPDVLTYPLIASGVVVAGVLAVTDSADVLIRAAVGLLGYGGWLLLIALLTSSGYGLGDVKLAAAVGVWTGALGWTTLTTGVLAGQLLITGTLIAARLAARRAGGQVRDAPLGPAIVLGASLAVLLTI